MAKKENKENAGKGSKVQGGQGGRGRGQKAGQLKEKAGQSMADLMSEIELPAQTLQRGDIVEGKVLTVTETDALIDLGVKSEGILPFSEFKGRDLSPGEKVLVYVLTPEDKRGQIRLSLKRAQNAKAWLDLKEAMAENKVLEAAVTGHNKGGLTVDIFGKTGFIPFSHLTQTPDLSMPRPDLQSALDKMRGEKLQVICLEIDVGKDRIILSERLAGQAELAEVKKEALQKIKVGQVMEGQVSGILPYGINVEVAGVEGLVELSELAWEQSEAALAEYEVGQKVKVQVLLVEKDTGKLRLSIKKLKKDPWADLVKKLKVGSRFTGEVIKISSLGVSVQDKNEIEGILPLSGLPDNKKDVRIGERITAVVSKVDEEERKVVLEMEREK